MKKWTLIWPVFLIQLMLCSCKKDYDLFVSGNNDIDSAWTNPLTIKENLVKLFDELAEEPVVENVADIALSGTIEFPGDIVVQIPEKGFIGNGGAPASGPAKVELLFLKSRGQFIRNSVPTSSNGNPLETSAELRITISQDARELVLEQGKYIIVSYPESSTSSSIRTHYAESAGTGNAYLNWQETKDGSYAIAFARPDPLSPGRTITGYDVKVRQLRWINCGMLTDTLNRSKVTATLPNIYTNANTKVFIAFADLKSVVQMKDDASARIFFAKNIPLGRSVRFISVSAVNSDYYLGISDASTDLNKNCSIKPQKKTFSEIAEFLKGL